MRLWILVLLMVGMVSFVSASCGDGQIDINSASVEKLDEIKWVGIPTAENIINSRPFESVDDLVRVSRLTETRVEEIKEQDLACVDGEEIVEAEEDVEEVEIVEEDIEEIRDEVVEEDVISFSDNAIETKEKTEIILLNNEKVEDEELAYISKDAKVVDYLSYAFMIFLIFIIGFLLLERF